MKTNNIFKIVALALLSYSANAQEGFGTSSPNQDAVIDLTSTNKGLLLPRLALTQTTNPAPLSAHVAGMTVYNTATANDVTPGYYNNDGTKWLKIGHSTGTGAPTITNAAAGDIYVDTTTGNLYTYNGTTWVLTATSTSDRTNDAWINNTTSTKVELGTTTAGAARTDNKEVAFTDNGELLLGLRGNPANSIPGYTSNRIEIWSDSGDASDILMRTGGTGASTIYMLNYDGPQEAPRASLLDKPMGWLDFSGHTGTQHSTGAIFTGRVDGVPSPTSMPGRFEFFTTPIGSLNPLVRMVIKNDGKVGINANTPTARLHAVENGAKTVATTGSLLSNTSTSTTPAINKTGLDVQSTGAWTGAGAINRGLNVTVSGGATNYAALFSGGNVGINTTTPAAKLHVVKVFADITPAIIEGCNVYADNAAATAANVPVGGLYRTATGQLMVRF